MSLLFLPVVVLLLTGARVGAVDEKLISRRSDSELLLGTSGVSVVVEEADLVGCIVFRLDGPLEEGGAISCTKKKIS